MDSSSSRRVGAFIVIEFAVVVGVLAFASVVSAPQPATSDDASPNSPPASESVAPGPSISISPVASGSISSGAPAPGSTIVLPTLPPPARDPSPTILVPPPIR